MTTQHSRDSLIHERFVKKVNKQNVYSLYCNTLYSLNLSNKGTNYYKIIRTNLQHELNAQRGTK